MPGFTSTQRFVVVYTSDSGVNDGIEFSILDGSTPIIEERLVTFDAESDNEPAMIGLPDGRFFIVWDDDTNGRLEGQRYTAAGNLLGAQLLLATGAVAEPALALTWDGRILVNWSELGVIHSMSLDPRGNVITGTALNDVLVAPTENATVNGLDGDDRLFGSLFNDTLDGGTGNDTLFGRDGNDRLIGGDGNDTAIGGIGNDVMFASAGNDGFDGHAGIDRVDYQVSTEAVAVSLLAGRGTGGFAQGDILVRIEDVIGSAFNDSLVGNSLANALFGAGGNDNLLGLSGNDTLSGGFGDDTLNGGSGGDTLNRSIGQDEVSYASALSAVTVNLTDGTRGGEAVGDVFSLIEVIRGSGHDDLLTGGTTAITLLGEAGHDTLTLGSGGGLMFGGAGNDTLFGTVAADTLVGGAGADTLFGGDGADEASYATAATGVFVNIGLGVFRFGDAVGDEFDSIENLRGSDFNDDLELGPVAGFVRAGAVNDTVRGGNGADTLFGEAGDDRLLGSVTGDRLFGGFGDDNISGGVGLDSMFGDDGKTRSLAASAMM